MRRMIYRILFLLCVSIVTMSTVIWAAPKEMDLRVNDPGVSSEWAVGSTNNVKWALKGGEWTGTVAISLQRAGWVNARMVLAESVPIGTGRTGSFKWIVPIDLPPGDNYSVTVMADNGIGETSPDFKIIPGKAAGVKLVLDAPPKGTEKWTTGSAVTIRWSYAGNPGSTVKLVLLKKDDGAVTTIAEVAAVGVDGKGHLMWTVPAGLKPGSDYRLGITSTSNAFYQDTSKEPIIVTATK
jgi:hypothetical protein